MSTEERRKNIRLGLAIPVRVQGYVVDGSTWEELATTDDVSLGGTSFALTHDVQLGKVLHLTLPLPKRLRQFDLHDASYRVYTLVRTVRRRPDGQRVGVMFFGRYPPRGFHERPAARYLLPTDSADAAPEAPDVAEMPSEASEQATAPLDSAPTSTSRPPVSWGTDPTPEPRPGVPPPPAPSAPTVEFHPSREVPQDRRGSPRVQMWVNFTIEQVDEWGQVLQEELTVADNVSRQGARVMTTLNFQVNDVILLQEAGGGFATRAEVRGITRVQPTTERLHIRFLDRQAPDRLLRQ